jgi:excisionase family DNA binding protein
MKSAVYSPQAQQTLESTMSEEQTHEYEPDDLLSTADAAEILGASDTWVRIRIKRGEIPATMIAGRWLIRYGDLENAPRPMPKGRPTKYDKK